MTIYLSARWKWIIVGIFILQMFIAALAVSNLFARRRLEADQRTSKAALDARGDLFKFTLDVHERAGDVSPDAFSRYHELQRRAGMPDTSTVKAAK